MADAYEFGGKILRSDEHIARRVGIAGERSGSGRVPYQSVHVAVKGPLPSRWLQNGQDIPVERDDSDGTGLDWCV